MKVAFYTYLGRGLPVLGTWPCSPENYIVLDGTEPPRIPMLRSNYAKYCNMVLQLVLPSAQSVRDLLSAQLGAHLCPFSDTLALYTS